MKNKRGWKDEVRTEKSERRGDEGKGNKRVSKQLFYAVHELKNLKFKFVNSFAIFFSAKEILHLLTHL